MEGYNPTEGCTARCISCRGGWVAFPWPSGDRPRRDPLIDAMNRTMNPCERPARYPPCCDPVPKYGLIREKPVCNLNCYQEERAAAKQKERYEEMQKMVDDCYCYQPEMIIQSLDPCRPLIVQSPPEISPYDKFHLRDQKCKTDIIAGFFNPDDNLTHEQRERRTCDPNWVSCGKNLQPYPCRGVIDFPCQRWISEAEEARMIFPDECGKTKYHQPEYQAEQRQLKLQKEMERQYQQRMEIMANAQREKMRFGSFTNQCYTGQCASGRCSESPYCCGM